MLVRASEGAAGSSGCGQETGGCNRGSEEDSEGTGSSSEEAQVSLSGSTVTAACCSAEGRRKREGRMEIEERVSGMRVREKVEDRSR